MSGRVAALQLRLPWSGSLLRVLGCMGHVQSAMLPSVWELARQPLAANLVASVWVLSSRRAPCKSISELHRSDETVMLLIAFHCGSSRNSWTCRRG